MKHALRVRITLHDGFRGYPEDHIQFVESEDFDPEDRTVGNLARDAFLDLVVNGGLRQTFHNIREDGYREDDSIDIFFDGECLANEAAWHVDEDYFTDDWVARHSQPVLEVVR